MTRDEIIVEAKTWEGTKWQHQACLKGVACDCIGLIRGVGAKWGLKVEKADLNYSQQPFHKDERLSEIMGKYMISIPLGDVRPGDVLLFGEDKFPAYHAGILSQDGFLIHTWRDIGAVVESRYTDEWQRNTRFAFRYPGVID